MHSNLYYKRFDDIAIAVSQDNLQPAKQVVTCTHTVPILFATEQDSALRKVSEKRQPTWWKLSATPTWITGKTFKAVYSVKTLYS